MPWYLRLTALPANSNRTSQSAQTHTHLHQRTLPNIPHLPPSSFLTQGEVQDHQIELAVCTAYPPAPRVSVFGHFCWSKCAFSRAIMTCNFLWCSSWHIRNSELHSPVLLGSNNTDRWPACRTVVEQVTAVSLWHDTAVRAHRARYNMAAQTASWGMDLLPQATRFSLRTNQCCENRSWAHWNLTLWLWVHESNLIYYKGIL